MSRTIDSASAGEDHVLRLSLKCEGEGRQTRPCESRSFRVSPRDAGKPSLLYVGQHRVGRAADRFKNVSGSETLTGKIKQTQRRMQSAPGEESTAHLLQIVLAKEQNAECQECEHAEDEVTGLSEIAGYWSERHLEDLTANRDEAAGAPGEQARQENGTQASVEHKTQGDPCGPVLRKHEDRLA